MFERAAEKVERKFSAEKHGTKSKMAVSITLNNGLQFRASAIVGQLESATEMNEAGDIEELETCTIDIPLRDLNGLKGIPYHASVLIDKHPGGAFAVATQGSRRTDHWLRLSLVRMKLIEERSARRR